MIYLLPILALYVVYRATSGLDNGLHYAKGNREYPIKLATVHSVEVLNTGLVTLMLFVAGLDAIQLWACAGIAGVAFKGFINLGTGRPFIDADESTDVDGDGRPGWTVLGFVVPKIFVGRYRLLASVLWLAVLIVWPHVADMLGLPYPLNLEALLPLWPAT